MTPFDLPHHPDESTGHAEATPFASSVDEASQTALCRLGKIFAAQRQWLNARQHRQGLQDARTVLRTFQATTGLPVDRIRGIGVHWGRHPVHAWMEADHYPLIAAWLLEGGCLPGEWCRPTITSETPGGRLTVPSARRPAVMPQTLSADGEAVLAQWFFRWGQTNAKLQNSIGRAISAWVRRADIPGPRAPEWAQPVAETVERRKEANEPAGVTFRAAIAVTQRGLRVVPLLRAMQRAGWDFEQAERLPSLPGRPDRVTSARAWLNELGIDEQLTVPSQAAWHRWWYEQDRATLNATMTSSAPPVGSPPERSRARL